MTVDVLLPGRVFAEVVSTGIRVPAEVQLVEQEDGEIIEVGGLRDVEPGEVIEVTDWAHIGAYVERGQIMLLTTAQAELHLAALSKAQHPTKTQTKTARS